VPQEAISFSLQAGYHFGHSVVVDASTALALVTPAHGSLSRQLLMVAGSSSGFADPFLNQQTLLIVKVTAKCGSEGEAIAASNQSSELPESAAIAGKSIEIGMR